MENPRTLCLRPWLLLIKRHRNIQEQVIILYMYTLVQRLAGFMFYFKEKHPQENSNSQHPPFTLQDPV